MRLKEYEIKKIKELYFIEHKKMTEIAKETGLCRQTVSKIVKENKEKYKEERKRRKEEARERMLKYYREYQKERWRKKKEMKLKRELDFIKLW